MLMKTADYKFKMFISMVSKALFVNNAAMHVYYKQCSKATQLCLFGIYQGTIEGRKKISCSCFWLSLRENKIIFNGKFEIKHCDIEHLTVKHHLTCYILILFIFLNGFNRRSHHHTEFYFRALLESWLLWQLEIFSF